LIDKVLARYSGEFTGLFVIGVAPVPLLTTTTVVHSVFRELLQNSDDAASKAVEIRFESKPFLERIEQNDTEASKVLLDLKRPVMSSSSINQTSNVRDVGAPMDLSKQWDDIQRRRHVNVLTIFIITDITVKYQDWSRLKKIGRCTTCGCLLATDSIL
jgi:ABC-type Fe2+-enterobactin transport system substrate-binding protein